MVVAVSGLRKTNMIITHLEGGLGNQFFQYAIGRKLSLKNKELFKLDLSSYTSKNPRTYGLKRFNIIENIATAKDLRNIFPIGSVSNFWWKFKKLVLRTINTHLEPHILNKKNNIYLDGFWQSEKYFSDISDTIRQDFKLRKAMSHASEIAYNRIKTTDISVSMHIRRGDYVQDKKTSTYHGICGAEYYEKAIAVLIAKLPHDSQKKVNLFVFSDDIDWVKRHSSFAYPVNFVSNPAIPDYEELILMSKCTHHIIANSSFSWWGAWLNPNPQKIVVAPAKWFNAKPSTYKDIVPNSWIKI